MPRSANFTHAELPAAPLSLGVRVALVCVHAYQLALSPFAGGACRFTPSCSAYALEALTLHGVWRGGRLAVARVARCHPFGSSGVDPVPPVD
ncbi:MAG: membrane protein insertion efficiency factor YidD [Gemmatimonadaceae bacterium]|nr:membrane protein insertion efficiency factor YidD [Acidobacteriota bacterium]MCC6241902.1 membrane protein insertion efficiency factor YidD [Gemmatimonadaceae bacterium]